MGAGSDRLQFFQVNTADLAACEAAAKGVNDAFGRIDILINNAGLGGTKKFTEASSDYINTILQVNVAATSLITHQLLPNLLKQPKAYILNVSSMAAFSPIGFKTVYPATKTFIHSFSRGLHEELKDTTNTVDPSIKFSTPPSSLRVISNCDL